MKYMLMDGGRIVVEGKRYRLKWYENVKDAMIVLKGWERPADVPSTQMPCLYDVYDDRGFVCCVHDWMKDDEVRWKVREGVSAREEIPPYDKRMEGRE